ncbi:MULTISPECIES: AraC family transcriptional regulator [unclassified Photobacterium]|uniref:helix-turn-helix domain-containing protein n=1 Tax=unclassified Photobacterium TaxID=2628852 RepID=UPI000D15E872|nr:MULTISPECIES: AraC family transcriptional regulator [unclassified Photobacterium]PSV26359.1 AraC family transcriptional regulator [Photobacterium sp. GB-56]PSV31526.1 AraC family transcriptional regulator [Photobacterium sp. GB-72]PSV33806.1 AraC family transcriptional regulator [Photobacterium sp. GB-27]PSV36813.1 AraC family transcriptional regulator [Photobacterium sp. GB-210]PSV46064.1 AraC family transcriptional regulator [Photobacterium sp. GB-36]
MEKKMPTFHVETLDESKTYHHHDYPQIIIGLMGQSELSIEDSSLCLSSGMGCRINANVNHGFCGGPNNQVLVMNLPPLISMTDVEQFSNGNFSLDARTHQLISLLAIELKEHAQDSVLSQSISNTLQCLINRSLMSFDEKKVTRLNMALIDSYIQQNIQKKISVADLSSIAFLAQSQFYVLFRKQMGITPHQYVLRKRLELAKQLIAETQKPLSEVAQLCGFSSQSSFSQAFRRLYGTSPIRYQFFIQ